MRTFAIAAAMLTLTACASAPPPAARPHTAQPPRLGSAIVPWLDRPAARAIGLHVASWRAPRAPRTAPACQPHQLRLRRVASNGAEGTEFLQLQWANRGTTACRAIGYPSIAAIDANGLVPLRPTHTQRPYFDGPPADIEPGGVVQATFSGFLDCPPGHEQRPRRQFDHFRVALPSGATVDVHREFATRCGVDVEALGVPSAMRPLHWRVLRADLHAPRTLRPGVLHYTVTLSNPYRLAYALRPCPTYVEFLGAGGREMFRRYQLNCSAVRTIAPHQAVTYAMQIRVPALHSDVAKFGWHVDGRYAPGTAVQVSVG